MDEESIATLTAYLNDLNDTLKEINETLKEILKAIRKMKNEGENNIR